MSIKWDQWGSDYDKKTLNLNLEITVRDWIKEFAKKKAAVGKKPNSSLVGNHLLKIAIMVVEALGDDLSIDEIRQALGQASEPEWAKKIRTNQVEILDFVKNLGNLTSVQVETIEEIKSDIRADFGEMLR